MHKSLLLAATSMLAWTLTVPAHAGDKPFPKTIDALAGSAPEGFAIGQGHTGYNGSVDGSIYKMDLRTGQGEILVPADSDSFDCRKLGMRVDPRTNYLFVAGCVYGNAYVFDADSGALLMEYQLDDSGTPIINDLAITEDAVYFTDSAQPKLYRLPLLEDGALPDAGVVIDVIPMPPAFDIDPNVFCCGGNGIVATPDEEALIVGHANDAMLYRVDLTTFDVDPVSVTPALSGFLDGIVMKGKTLYILTPTDPAPIDGIQVVEMDSDMFSGNLVRVITDPDLDDVASGAFFGNSLYVNNARYSEYPGPDTEYWVTKVSIK